MRHVAPVKEVHYTGGEPFLYYDRLVEAVAMARKLGATRITCSTNCYWADDLEEARGMLGKLKEAGLTWFLISADAFHQDAVPLTNVRIAAQVRVELGLQGNDDLSVVAMINPDYDHPFNTRTREIVEQVLAWGHGASLHCSMPYGRGHDLVPEDECKMTLATRKCWEFRTWGFIEPKGPRTVIIGPDENVMVCYGVSLGNLRVRPLAELLKEFDENPNPVVRTLLKDGIEGLAARAESHGWKRHSTYQNECHLCYCVRDHLRRHEPEFLQPVNCYPA
jgi:MoaA/NifB/PqqE/SkfB family radical SAM enzyme